MTRSDETIYRGEMLYGPEEITMRVCVGGVELSPARSLRFFERSPRGYQWSWDDPWLLSFALILDATNNPRAAYRWYESFTLQSVMYWPYDIWEVTAGLLRETVQLLRANHAGRFPDDSTCALLRLLGRPGNATQAKGGGK